MRDISTGQLQYFVLNKNKGRGAWFPCNKVDAAAYIVERGRREAKLREGWSKRKAVHNQIIRERQAKELAARRAKEEVLRKIAAEKAAALAKERKKSILAEQAAKQEQRKQAVEKLKVQFKDVLTSHETQVGGLLTSCTKLKLRAIPEPKMNGIRLSTLRKLKELNKQVHKYGGSPFSKTDLTKLLSEAESRAQSKFTIENAARLEAEKKEAAKRIAAKKEAEKRAMASKLQQLYSQQQSTGRNSASSSSLSSFSQSSAQFSRPPSSQYSRPQSSSSTAMMQGSLDPNTMNAMLQQMKGTVVHSQAVPPAHPTAQMVHRPSSNASSLSFGSTQASHSSSLSSAGGGGNAQQFGSQSQQGAFHPHAYQITSEPSKVNSQQHGVAIGAANTASNDMMHLLRTMRPSSQYANGAGNMQQMASQLLHQQRPSEPNNNYRQQMNLAQQAQGYQSHPTQFQYGQQNNHVQMPASYGQAQNFHQFNSMAGQLSQQHQQHQAQQFGLQQSLPSHGGLSNQLQSQLQQQYGMQPIRQRQQQQQQQNQFGVDFEPSPVDNISYGNADRYQQANNNNNVPGRNQNNQWM